ncbi:AAA family ATPase [Curtobacterium sp. MCPF17_021]|uniref:AAA family ATPase n=1 Tax=Curtobacterium sp. MCPF17_021 TaxID=2175639 RepID=UPI000DAA633A|nr:AAA family ATPase [Curtobacterium sp. MCPF17_021]WIE83473.1 AAA family ATPase [Curtobacterium sp. MCPF17_021]
MRLAITGAYGSGKSTLAKAAAERFGLQAEALPPMQDPFGSRKAATGCSPAQLVELVVRRLIERSARESGDLWVSDGSLVHDWVFAKTLLLHGVDPDAAPRPTIAGRGLVNGLLEPSRRAVRSSLHDRYDVVVHLPIEFAMTETAPPVSESFRTRSEEYLAEELALAGLRPKTVTGSVEDRLEQIAALVAVPTATAA